MCLQQETAKTDDGFVYQFFFVLAKGVWKFSELCEAPVNGAFECSFIDLVIVASVQNDHWTAIVVKALV